MPSVLTVNNNKVPAVPTTAVEVVEEDTATTKSNSSSITSPTQIDDDGASALQHTKVAVSKKRDYDNTGLATVSLLNPSTSTLTDEDPKTKRRRGKNWGRHELLLIVKAWSSISEDAATGTDQSGARLWGRIHKKFEELKQAARKYAIEQNQPAIDFPDRSELDLKKQWSSSVNLAIQAFVGICAQNVPKSGVQDESTHYQQMLEIYKQRASKKDIPKAFDRFLPAYQWLKTQPKFSSHFLNGEGHEPGEPKTSKPRPRGRDAAKLDKKTQSVAGSVIKTMRAVSIIICIMYIAIHMFHIRLTHMFIYMLHKQHDTE